MNSKLWLRTFSAGLVLTTANCGTARVNSRIASDGQSGKSMINVEMQHETGLQLTGAPVLSKVEAICANNTKYSANLAAGQTLEIKRYRE